METLKLNDCKITNTYRNQVFQNYDQALDFATYELGWDADKILERKETITLEIDGEIERETLNCLLVDPGSDDYLYFIKH
jgi:hypothetical protein